MNQNYFIYCALFLQAHSWTFLQGFWRSTLRRFIGSLYGSHKREIKKSHNRLQGVQSGLLSVLSVGGGGGVIRFSKLSKNVINVGPIPTF